MADDKSLERAKASVEFMGKNLYEGVQDNEDVLASLEAETFYLVEVFRNWKKKHRLKKKPRLNWFKYYSHDGYPPLGPGADPATLGAYYAQWLSDNFPGYSILNFRIDPVPGIPNQFVPFANLDPDATDLGPGGPGGNADMYPSLPPH